MTNRLEIVWDNMTTTEGFQLGKAWGAYHFETAGLRSQGVNFELLGARFTIERETWKVWWPVDMGLGHIEGYKKTYENQLLKHGFCYVERKEVPKNLLEYTFLDSEGNKKTPFDDHDGVKHIFHPCGMIFMTTSAAKAAVLSHLFYDMDFIPNNEPRVELFHIFHHRKNTFMRWKRGADQAQAQEPPRKWCRHCFEERPSDYNFCPKCGKDLHHHQLAKQRAPVSRAVGSEKVPIGSVLCLQNSISPYFRNGERLEDLITGLREGKWDPMEADFLVLNMAKASVDGIVKYYTFDHRRLYCMWQAGFKTVRARITLEGPVFDEFVRKADFHGHTLKDLDRSL